MEASRPSKGLSEGLSKGLWPFEADFLERLLDAEKQRDQLQAQVSYGAYELQRQKDLLEAELRAELEDARHQQELQVAQGLRSKDTVALD